MTNKTKKKTVFVAMSGGVDSSVAAALLKEQGFRVVGVTMCFNIKHPKTRRPSCCGIEGIEDARRAAQVLDIPHYVLNFGKDLDRFVIQNFKQEYLNGRTPNPCIRCNQFLKFGTLFKKVRALGADFLATGHYVKVAYNKNRRTFELKKGKDKEKDQSYFLYGISKRILPRLLFPLGNLTKSQVRALAKKFKLRNAEKPASQDICFIPDAGYKKFLAERISADAIVPGPIQYQDGRIVGEHKGIARYTIGQRDGLGVSLGKPVYVYKIDKNTNTILVGDSDKLLSRGLVAGSLNFVSAALPRKKIPVTMKIRYHKGELKGTLICAKDRKAHVEFQKLQKAVTPGQSVVFYKKDVVLGGGVIEKSIE